MKTQTIEEMKQAGASEEKAKAALDLEEAKAALDLWALLAPGLKIKQNGRVDTAVGDKTPLGLYRTIGSHIFNK